MTTATRIAITEPGVYDIPAEDYLPDPVPGGSLSASGARKLLPPSCPARFRYDADHPPAPTPEFDLGHAAHKLVLGAGPDLVPIDAEDWRTKAAKEQRAAAHAADAVPLLRADYERVQAMAAALRQHPLAGALLQPDRGKPEQSLFWIDGETRMWCRARLDWLPNATRSGRLIAVDYKSTRSAAPDYLQRAVHQYGYHAQAAFYLDGIKALGLADDAAFVFVAQEKEPPYLVTVFELAESALHIGRDLNRKALRLYRDCVTTGIWPGYCADVELIALPAWAERNHFNEEHTP